MTNLQTTQDLPVLTVSQLNEQVQSLLESSFPIIALEAELSNLSKPRSGHWYFSLKDDKAQVRCAMFRFHNQRCRLQPEEGKQVLILGRVTLYQPRGDYQIVVEQMQEAGVGRLQAAFEELKQKLKQAGLFEAQYKQPLPKIPQRVTIITSSSGAAIQDIQQVLNRRAPYLAKQIQPVLVQGETAASQIIEALQTTDKQQWAQVIILARGGGSLEDLWCFNDENLARVIFDCQTPIVTGIGHETDFTISDFVADLRAPTPSAAAEQVAPDYINLLQTIQQHQQRLEKNLVQNLQTFQQKFDWLHKRLQQAHPSNRIQQQKQRLNLVTNCLHHWQLQLIQYQRQRLQAIQFKLQAQHPQQLLHYYKQRIEQSHKSLCNILNQHYQQNLNRFSYLQRHLKTLSPQATLERGYAIVKDSQQQIIKSGQSIQTKQAITVELADSWLFSTVNSKELKTHNSQT